MCGREDGDAALYEGRVHWLRPFVLLQRDVECRSIESKSVGDGGLYAVTNTTNETAAARV